MEDTSLRSRLGAMLTSQKLAVLSTQQEGQPYASLVAFAATEDLKGLAFATPRPTRKYANLKANERVALLIDTRSNEDDDFHAAMAATAVGGARELEGEERRVILAHYLAKHPHLSDFAAAPTCALFLVEVDIYHVVDRFQHVMEWRCPR